MDVGDSDSALSEIDDAAFATLAREYERYLSGNRNRRGKRRLKIPIATNRTKRKTASIREPPTTSLHEEEISSNTITLSDRPANHARAPIDHFWQFDESISNEEPVERTILGTIADTIFVNPQHLAISKRLTTRLPWQERCLPVGAPRVWADSRQALYETLPYFRKAQGGCQQNDHHVYAFLFDGDGHDREYMDEDLIIARSTGGMVVDDQGNMSQGKDQAMTDVTVQAIRNDMLCYNPLIIICGQYHSGVHVRLPHRYCVLGWYKTVAVWAEKSGGAGRKRWTTIKFRFERLDLQDLPWHQRQGHNNEEKRREISSEFSLITRTCRHCLTSSPQVYLEMWTCLDSTCTAFWKIGDAIDAPVVGLNYHPAFLASRTHWPNEQAPYDVRPPLPDVGRVIGDNLTYINTRGVVCPVCGRCNSRYLFRKWVCDNLGCAWPGLEPIHSPIVPTSMHQPWDRVGDGPSLARNQHQAGVVVNISYTSGYKICTYRFAGIDGCFIHAISNGQINRSDRGPDEMLTAMQTIELGLQRGRFARRTTFKKSDPPLRHQGRHQMGAVAGACLPGTTGDDSVDRSPGVHSGDYMVAFSVNYGMPYKFAASCATQSFDGSPWPVRACRARLNWARRTLLGEDSTADFNELLVFAYMEGQKIDYHDDGEHGLGPCVASLSLGCRARMSLRVKAKHYTGCSKSGILTRERPLPMILGGRSMYERRLAALEEIDRLQSKDSTLVAARLKALPRELGLYDRRNKKAEELLTVTLSHGDIMLMKGHDLQRYLEHRVVPEGLLRFAMTGRDILPEHLEVSELPAYPVRADDYTTHPI